MRKPMTPDTSFAQSFDALVWAEAFVRHVEANPAIATDAETMVGWFANALMRGWDEHANRHPGHDELLAALKHLAVEVGAVLGIAESALRLDEWLDTRVLTQRWEEANAVIAKAESRTV